jgi:RNA-directed DNA polymerase
MKRQGNLYHQIVSYENLIRSARQAQRSKRLRSNVLEFNYHLEIELEKLQNQLQNKTYQPGNYKSFRIFDPKPRLISAAPYRDRVVHHALCNIIMPIIERTFIHDTYANRTGYGTHRALRRFTKFSRSSQYILQCDIRLYFPSIDHEILKTILRRKIKCPDTLWLIDTIIDHSNAQEPVIHYFPGDNLLTPLDRRHGLPIGNLTSQFFANVYLNGFDRFVKDQLLIHRYLRYVDDFALFSNDRTKLVDARVKIESYLADLRLKLHPIKSQLFQTQYGANFVGFRVLPDRIRVRSDNLQRGRLRIKQLRQDYEAGKITVVEVDQSLQSWEAHLKHGDTCRLCQDIFQS